MLSWSTIDPRNVRVLTALKEEGDGGKHWRHLKTGLRSTYTEEDFENMIPMKYEG